EHGLYVAGVSDLAIDNVYVESPRYQDGGGTNPHTGTVAIKVSYDNPDLRISNSQILLTATSTTGIGVEDSNFGRIAISNSTATITNDGQTGLSAASKGGLLATNLIVDGGAGYHSVAISFFAVTSGSSYNMEVNGAHVMGNWLN